MKPKQINQVLINLVKNAVEVIQHEIGSIIINANISEGKLNLSISDNGEGIPEEVLSEVFIPFFTTRKEGSGIGLSISRQIIRTHEGELRINSKQKNGTRSEMLFPMVNSLT